jgi:hypothetical protein
MRVFAAMLLSMSLAAAPLLANDAKDAAKEDSPVAVSGKAAVPDKPKETATPENAVIESELQDLRSLVQSQMQELESQRAALKAQQLKMEVLEEKLHATPSEPVSASVAEPSANPEATPAAAIGSTPRTFSATAAIPAQGGEEEKPSPLYFKIGAAEFYPLGFMDLTNIYRTTTTGTGIGTGFNSVPFSNSIQGHTSEDRFSAQNSRIGLRTHAKFGEADVTGYLEADFLGFLPTNGYDTSNSDSLRMRLYWVDYKQGKFEVLGGQSWSFMTPNRNGLSALPADLFYSQDVDTNYQLGLTWARQAGVRFIVHPNSHVAMGLAIENPEQTCPGGVTFPPGVSANDGSQCDTNSGGLTNSGVGTNTSNVANLHPDVILKAALDGGPEGHHVHFDVAGLFRSFKAVNLISSLPNNNLTSANTTTDTIHGGGIAATANVELVKNFRFIATAFFSSGGGRYIASTAGPDFIVRPDGNLSGVHSGSGIGGFEFQANPKTMIYGYYSGAYFNKNWNGAGTVASPYSGYGFPASSPNANRYLYEPTFGIHYTMWRNPNYGDLRLMTQVSYVSRAPWFVSPPSVATPTALSTAHNAMVYIDLRYDLP